MALLDNDAINAELADTPGWERSGDAIVKTFILKDFREAIGFINRVAEIAEEEDHHPDIDVRWNKITLAMTTHSAGGITTNDFRVARRLSEL